MSKQKRQKSKFVQHAEALAALFQGAGRPVLITVGVALVLIAASVFAWQKWGGEIQQDSRFRLSPEKLDVSEQPAWIWTEVKTEVFREHALAERSLLDKQLVQQVADAFAVHPWVAEVNQVRKTAAGVVVDVQYRRPVAMVEILLNGAIHLVLVDRQGIVLPTDQRLESHVDDFLRISLSDLRPYGPAGTSWGDQRVAEAASIAAAWGNQWKKIKLYRIAETTAANGVAGPGITYELQTRQGKRVLWGRPPGREAYEEVSAAKKIESLVSFVESNGDLDRVSELLDLRTGHVDRVSSARLPGP